MRQSNARNEKARQSCVGTGAQSQRKHADGRVTAGYSLSSVESAPSVEVCGGYQVLDDTTLRPVQTRIGLLAAALAYVHAYWPYTSTPAA